MSDKPLVQQALASSLAGLTLDVRPKDRKAGRVERFRAAMTYLRGFWEACVREWSGLDRLRCVRGGVAMQSDTDKLGARTGSINSTSSFVDSSTPLSYCSRGKSGILLLSPSTTLCWSDLEDLFSEFRSRLS